jgi:diguanylate cyclase (GGDEF)-like protein
MRRSNREVRRAGEELREMLDRANADAVRQQAQAQQKEFETELANALEMAEGEAEVLGVIEHAFDLARPESPVELLLADNSHAHLLRVARSSAAQDQRGCQVDSPDHCPAARRGQTQRFADSEKLGACPKLREHGADRCSAVCVPVSIMGRTVGVVHATGTVNEPMSEIDVTALNTVASLGGARLGMIRMVAEVALQASTDSLTGLLNRRAFERAVTASRREHSSVAVAMADLDHFKALNDTYGHETGDRALRVFAQTLRTCVRASDLVARHGGEEFAIALPDCSAEDALSILETLRVQIERSAAQAGLPQFTASFGVVEIGPDEDLPSALGRADQALFEAKRSGRNRVVQSLRCSPEVPAPTSSQLVAAVAEDAPAA